MEFATAVSSAELTPPPRLMLATAGAPGWWFPVTQSTPAMTPAVLPLPAQSSTRTATSRTPGATPYWLPPMVPATCVPWPLQSSALPPSTSSTPDMARPPKSVWPNVMPVSMTYAVTPAPVAVCAYRPSRGVERWSIRSRPQVTPVGAGAGGLVGRACTTRSASTATTPGRRDRAAPAADGRVTAKPFSAELYTWSTCPPTPRVARAARAAGDVPWATVTMYVVVSGGAAAAVPAVAPIPVTASA